MEVWSLLYRIIFEKDIVKLIVTRVPDAFVILRGYKTMHRISGSNTALPGWFIDLSG